MPKRSILIIIKCKKFRTHYHCVMNLHVINMSLFTGRINTRPGLIQKLCLADNGQA